MGQAKLADISGIGPHTAQVLADHGIGTVEALASTPVGELAKIPGFGPVRAEAVRTAALVLQQKSPTTGKKTRKKKDEKGKKKDKKAKGKKKDKKRKGKKKDKKRKGKKKDKKRK